MLVVRISIALVIVSMFASCAEAQLFRFRANQNFGSRYYSGQQLGYPSNYDANSYRYTQVQPQTNYVPSNQTARCNQQRGNYAAVGSAVATQQQTEIVSVTYRDPYTGRLFQRQYVVQRATPQNSVEQQKSVANATKQSADKQDADMLPELPNQALSKANPIGVMSPELNSPGVQTTSFESPASDSKDAAQEFSVLTSGDATVPQSTSVLESSLPILELQEEPGSILQSSSDSDLNVDLPPLQLNESK